MTAIMKLQKDFVHVQTSKKKPVKSAQPAYFDVRQYEHKSVFSFVKYNPFNRWNCSSTFIARLTVT